MKNTKLMTALMAGTMIAGSILPAFAATVEVETNPTGTQSAAVTYDSTPTLQPGEYYTVKIPKNIDMGNKKTATYEVGVAGKMSETSVTITPDASFKMVKKDDVTKEVTATVTQNDTDWSPEELENSITVETEGNVAHYVMHEGTISAQDLTEGVWSGTLTFTIGIK